MFKSFNICRRLNICHFNRCKIVLPYLQETSEDLEDSDFEWMMEAVRKCDRWLSKEPVTAEDGGYALSKCAKISGFSKITPEFCPEGHLTPIHSMALYREYINLPNFVHCFWPLNGLQLRNHISLSKQCLEINLLLSAAYIASIYTQQLQTG